MAATVFWGVQAHEKVVCRSLVVLHAFPEKLLVMSEVPNPVSSWHDVFRNPPVDLNLALRQDEVSPVPHELCFPVRVSGDELPRAVLLRQPLHAQEGLVQQQVVSWMTRDESDNYGVTGVGNIWWLLKAFTEGMSDRMTVEQNSGHERDLAVMQIWRWLSLFNWFIPKHLFSQVRVLLLVGK